MIKHYHSNKYDKRRKYYDNPRPVQKTNNTVNTPNTVNTEYVALTTVQDYPVNNGIKDEIELCSVNSNGSTNNTLKFVPQEKFLINLIDFFIFKNANIAEKVGDVNKSIPYYPLPSNEGYEKFLQTMKKDQCNISK